jgi:hypothetical protein
MRGRNGGRGMHRKRCLSVLAAAGAAALWLGVEAPAAIFSLDWYNLTAVTNRTGALVPYTATNFFLALYTAEDHTIPAYTYGEAPVYAVTWNEAAGADGYFWAGLISEDPEPHLISGAFVYTRVLEGSLTAPVAWTTLAEDGLAMELADPSPSSFAYEVPGVTASAWTVIPEPTTWTILAAAGLLEALLCSLRRRR